MLNHIHPYEIVNGVVEFQGVPEEVKTEQKDKDVEGWGTPWSTTLTHVVDADDLEMDEDDDEIDVDDDDTGRGGR
ncbi:unnamed protein product [Brassica rapa subsp. narinosa]|uniref:(rape) hypothetical protein n=1 Tax=Brassica napus TaxID=3708 RepID=A0A816Y4U0_BRANA|nr:unnamed protein product [Brassica napus]